MDRETIARRIYWSRMVWVAGVLNPCMMLPQLYALYSTGLTSGISLPTLGILIFLQGVFSVHGFFIRDRLVTISNGLACLMTVLTTIMVLYLRS